MIGGKHFELYAQISRQSDVMAKRSTHTSPTGQRLAAKTVPWRPLCEERTVRGRARFPRLPAEFSARRCAGRQRTARGRSEDAGRRGRAKDKRWIRVGNGLGLVDGGVRCDVLTPSLLFSGELSKASSKRYFLKKRRSDDDRCIRR